MCVSVRDGSGMFVGGTRLVTHDLHTFEPQTLRRMFKNIGLHYCYKRRKQSGSSSQSGRNQGAAAEADANGEQQLKWIDASYLYKYIAVFPDFEGKLCTNNCKSIEHNYSLA